MRCNFESCGDGIRLREELGGEVLGGQIEEFVDELILLANVLVADPPSLPLPDHVHRLIPLNRSARCLELAEPLLGVHTAFDRSAAQQGLKYRLVPPGSLWWSRSCDNSERKHP